jgi:hypothetical protein
VDGEDSLRFSDVGTTTALSEGSEHLSGNAVVGSAALPSFDACSSFRRQHLKPMEARLFTSEHVISCTQRVTLSRLLQRE